MVEDPKNVESQMEAAKLLKEIIGKKINALQLPTGLGADPNEIRRGILQKVDANVFDKHNQSGIVEVQAVFEGKRADGTTIFKLKIVWDADNPPPDSRQTAHYGWEIYLNDTRVAGPSHVFFTPNIILSHYRRPNLPMTEEIPLRLKKSGAMGSGTMDSETRYFKMSS